MSSGLLGHPLGRADLGGLLRDVEDGEQITAAPPVTDLTGWWDASAFDTLTIASDLVSQWNDLSGNGNNAVQATGGAKPGYGGARERKINGVIVLDFDRGDGMGVSGVSGADTSISAFIVAEVDLIGTGAGATMLYSTSAGWPILYTGDAYLRYQSNGTSATLPSPVPKLATPMVYGVVWDVPTLTFVCNDTRFVTSATDAGAAGTLEIGSRGGGQPFDGGMAEFLWYARPLSTDEIIVTVEYLMRKWGVVA